MNLNSRGRRKLREKLIKRDGLDCFYCGETMSLEWMDIRYPGFENPDYYSMEKLDATLNYSLDNCVLAHKLCNNKAARRPVRNKLLMFHKQRRAV